MRSSTSMNKATIAKIAKTYRLRLSERREGGKRVLGLHGFLADLQAAEREICGYYIQASSTGYYLYSERSVWV